MTKLSILQGFCGPQVPGSASVRDRGQLRYRFRAGGGEGGRQRLRLLSPLSGRFRSTDRGTLYHHLVPVNLMVKVGVLKPFHIR